MRQAGVAEADSARISTGTHQKYFITAGFYKPWAKKKYFMKVC
jgi:hypothetical protein